MTPERLQQIESLYHSAREASFEMRAALLAQADPEVRRQVESLLSHQNDALILDHPLPLPDDSAVATLRPGAQLGPYQVESRLGDGGMGEVFRAVDTRLGRAVALKFAHERFSARFEGEARAISSLNHPHICTLYDIGPNYLVMELLDGDTLAARLKNGPLPLDQALHFASQILAALADAHEHGIVHRDLKPGNIMLVKSGVKILDFGLAIRDGEESITDSRMVIGTPAYMAPEQREGKPATVRTDLYSFGCIFYEMLTGARVSSDRKPVFPPTLEKIVRRCLEPEAAKRWQSATELASALQTSHAGKSRIRVASAAVMVATFLVAIAVASYFWVRPTPKLTDKDTLVLADFLNNTGDPIFDNTLRQGLAFQLEQSPFLKIMDDEQVQRVLRLMSLQPGTHISQPIAHEICVREGAAATLEGTIASLGKAYVLTLQAVACQNGATLAREQIQAEDKEHVLSSVGIAATAMRTKLGESRSSVQKLDLPLEEATTPSLEALQNYTAGFSELVQGHSLAAVPSFERAITFDPNFAMAYQYLAIAFGVAGDTAKNREYTIKAFGLIERISEFERDMIVPHYYHEITGELDKATDAYQLSIRNYPRYWGPHNNLGDLYIDLGRYEEGLKEGLEGARLQANAEPSYRRQLDAYLCLDRLSEAKQLMAKLRAQGIDRSRIHQRFLEMAYIEDDQTTAAREIQWFTGKQEEYLSLGLQAASRNVHGRRRESHELFQRAAEAALRHGLRSVASEYEESDARADALIGNCQTARRLGRPALAMAMCGDAAQAEKLAGETSKIFPNGTLWNAVHLPAIRAAIALPHNAAKSVELLASATPYELAYFESVYLRGLAYLKLNEGAKAVAEFQKIVNHKGANWASDWLHPYQAQFYALAYLGEARGFALTGDTEKAKKTLQGFFDLWKDADSSIPILAEAKTEYAKLH